MMACVLPVLRADWGSESLGENWAYALKFGARGWDYSQIQAETPLLFNPRRSWRLLMLQHFELSVMGLDGSS